ncbi:HpcH/HpaI aldolase/citrate lyase family protein [Nocardia sp. NPDC059091]|uniref:HpcH/HpaI aldolase family protein n=1 Tax=Nocardia sp. NPDC059091 TaxID=3346724 RepID=UPI00368F29F4
MKEKLQRGERVLGCSFNEARDPGSVHALAAAGADTVFFDFEHNAHNTETVLDLVAHAHGAGITPLVRPPSVEYEWITRLLDGGCQSLLIPHLRTPAEVHNLIELSFYHPLGRRGVVMVGGAGVNYQEVTDVRYAMRWANQQTLLGLVIETAEAVENLPDMLVPGIGLAVVGHQDLAHSFGVAGEPNHHLVVDAEHQVAALCRQRGIAFGAFRSDPVAIHAAFDQGAQLIVHGGILAYIRRCVREAAHLVKGDCPDTPHPIA